MGPSQTATDLSGVAETLLMPLYIRALENARPNPLVVDKTAVAFMAAHREQLARIARIHMDDSDRAAVLLRNRELDRQVRVFLGKHPGATVIHIGCGLDSRFERVDDGLVDWYDLDLPDVIALRRAVLGGEAARYHLLSTSVFEEGWLDTLQGRDPHTLLFVAEGVFMYCEEREVRALVARLCKRFAGCELVFDAFSPFIVHANNLRLRLSRSHIDARYKWGLRDAHNLESWQPEVRLLEQWFPLSEPEPRMARLRWMRHIPLFAKVLGVYRYQLGRHVF